MTIRCAVCGLVYCQRHKPKTPWARDNRPAPYGRLGRGATPEQVAQAMGELRQLFEPSARMRASAAFEAAKVEFDAATIALMNREPGCEARADRALEELEAARAALRLLDAQETER